MKFDRRIRALEAKMSATPVILHFADGTTRAMCGRTDFLLDLLQSIGGEDVSPDHATHLELVRRSVGADEPGGGRMIEMLRALMHDPANS